MFLCCCLIEGLSTHACSLWSVGGGLDWEFGVITGPVSPTSILIPFLENSDYRTFLEIHNNTIIIMHTIFGIYVYNKTHERDFKLQQSEPNMHHI